MADKVYPGLGPSLLDQVLQGDDYKQNINDFSTGTSDLKDDYLQMANINKIDSIEQKEAQKRRNLGVVPNRLNKYDLATINENLRANSVKTDELGRKYVDGLYGKRFLQDQDEALQSVYQGPTTDGDAEKLGKSHLGFDERFNRWPAGPQGIDTENPETEDTWMQTNSADLFEGLTHGNEELSKENLYADDTSNLSAVQNYMYGPGKSEYFPKGTLDFLNDKTLIPEDEQIHSEEFKKYMSQFEKNQESIDTTYVATDLDNSLSEYTDEEKLLMWREQKAADAAGWKGKSIAKMNEEEYLEYVAMKNNSQLEQGYYSDSVGPVNLAKKFAEYGTKATLSLLDLGGEASARIVETGISLAGGNPDSKQIDEVRDFWNLEGGSENNSANRISQSLFGTDLKEAIESGIAVNNNQSASAHKEMKDSIAKDRYSEAFFGAIGNIDTLLADSLPEMVGLMSWGGFATVINKRVHEQNSEFKKVTGKDMTDKEMALAAVMNTAVLGIDKVLLANPTRDLFKKVLGIGSTAAKNVSKESAGVIYLIAQKGLLATGTEAIQEPTDQAIENYWKKGGSGDKEGAEAFTEAFKLLSEGKIITADEAKAAAISGAALGLVLGGTVEGGKALLKSREPMQEDIDAMEVPEVYMGTNNRTNDLFADMKDLLSEYIDEDDNLEKTSVDLSDEVIEEKREIAKEILLEIEEIPEEDVNSKGALSAQLYNFLFGPLDQPDAGNGMAQFLFKGNKENANLDVMKEILTKNIEAGLAAEAEVKAEEAANATEAEEVEVEPEESDAVKEARGFDKELNIEYASEFNEDEAEEDMKAAEEDGNYDFIGNPDIRKEYEDKWETENRREPVSRGDTIADLKKKKKLIEQYGEPEVTVAPEPVVTPERNEEDLYKETPETEDKLSAAEASYVIELTTEEIGDTGRWFKRGSKRAMRAAGLSAESTGQEIYDGLKRSAQGTETLKKVEKQIARLREAQENKKGTQNETIDDDDATPFGDELGAMPKNTKKKVKFQKLTNESGTVYKKKAGERKTQKKVAGILSDKSFLESFMYGAREKKGEKNLKHANQQRNSNKKSTLRDREAFLSKLYDTVTKGLENADSKTAENFNLLMENTDGSKKSAEGMGAVAGRLAVIAMDKILSDIDSNVDRTINENALPLGDMYASRQNINKEIGKSFVESYGQQAVPATDSSKDSEAVNRYLAELGNVGIAILNDMGYAEHLEEGQNIFDTGFDTLFSENNTDIKNEKDAAKEARYEELMGLEVPLLFGADVITVPEDFIGFKGIAGNESSADVTSSIDSVIAPIMKALLPANKRDPQHTPPEQDVQPRGHDNEISPVYNDVVRDYLQDKKLFIRPEIIDLLLGLAVEMKTEGRRVPNFMNTRKYAWVKNMFDLNVNKNISPAEQLSERGKYRSRLALAESVMQMFMDNINDKGDLNYDFDELYYTYFKALNERLHVDEIAFNFQADNFFSRHAMATSTQDASPTFKSKEISDPAWKEEINVLIAETLAEEVGIRPEEALDTNTEVEGGSNEAKLNSIETLIGDYISGELDLEGFLSDSTIKKHEDLFKSMKSPLHLWRVLKGINDLRMAYSTSKNNVGEMNVETDFSPEFDANNSGFVNKLLNALGSLDSKTRKEIISMLKKLTIADKDGQIGDAYNFLTDIVQEKINGMMETSTKKQTDELKKEQKLLNELIGFIEDTTGMRDLSKYPLLAGIYGQGEASLSRELGFEITKSIMQNGRSETNPELNTRAEELLNKDPGSITLSDLRVAAQEIGNLMGRIYSESLETLEGPITEENKLINDAYGVMEKASVLLDEDLTLRSPFEVVVDKVTSGFLSDEESKDIENAKYVFSIMKRKNVVTDHRSVVEGASDTYMTEQKFMPNPNSIRVIPLHAIDTAVMLVAYVKAVAEMKRRGRELGGTMPIHDAVIGSPEFMEIYRRMYNEAALDVAEHYDIKNEVVRTIDSLIEQLNNYESGTGFAVSPKAYIEDLMKYREALMKDNDKRMAQKKEDLDYLRKNGAMVFGTTKHTLGGSTVTVNERTRTETTTESRGSTKRKLTPKQKERNDLNDKERIDAEKEAHKGKSYTIDESGFNSPLAQDPTKERIIENNDRMEDVIRSGEPYMAIDLETSFGKNTTENEIVQMAISIYEGKKLIKHVGGFFLPSNALAYARAVVNQENNGKDYLPYSVINENANEADGQKIESGESEFDSTRSDTTFNGMEDVMNAAKKVISNRRRREGILEDKSIPIIAFNGNAFDFPVLTNNIGLDNTEIFEYLDATYLAEEQLNDVNKQEGQKPMRSSLAKFMNENEVEFDEGMTAHDGQADVKGMMDATFKYLEQRVIDNQENVRTFNEESGSSSINDLLDAFRANEPRETKIANAIKILDNMLASNDLSEDGRASAEELIIFLGEGDFNIESWTESRGEFIYSGADNSISVTDSVYDVNDTNDVLKYLVHETEHWASAKFIKKEMKKDIKDMDPHVSFLGKVLDGIVDKMAKNVGSLDKLFAKYDNKKDSFEYSPVNRLQYVLKMLQDEDIENWKALAEFVAIYRAEPDFRAMINEIHGDNGRTANKIVTSIKELMIRAMGYVLKFNTDMQDQTAENIAFAVDTITALGLQQKMEEQSGDNNFTLHAQPRNEVQMIDKSLNYVKMNTNKPAYFSPHEVYMNSWNNTIRKFIKSNGMKYFSKTWDNKWVKKFHEDNMSNEEGVYFRTMGSIKAQFEPGTLLSEIGDYTGINRKYADKRDQLITIWTKAVQDRNRIDLEMSERSKVIFNRVARKLKLKPAQKAAINKMFNNSLIHSLDESDTDTSLLAEILGSKDKISKIDEKIVELVQMLDTSITDAKIDIEGGINKYAEDIANYLQTGVVGDLSAYFNPFDKLKDMNPQNYDMTQKLIALHQLRMNGKKNIDMLDDFRKESARQKKGDSFVEFLGISRSNAALVWEVDKDMADKQQYRFDNITGSQIKFKERYVFEVVDEVTFNRIISSQDGKEYIVLQKPNETQGVIGLVAKIDTGFGYQAGLASQISINNDGVSVPYAVYKSVMGNTIGADEGSKKKSIIKGSNIIQSTNKGYHDMKMIFTAEMLGKLEIRNDPSESLHNAYGHNIEIQHGKAAIKWLIENEIYDVYTIEDAKKLEKKLKKGKDVAYFVNFNIDEKLLSEFPNIVNTYKDMNRATNVYGFNRRANMVHKNSAYQTIGFNKKAVLADKRLQKAERVWRGLITGFKSRVALLSAKKIARDAISTGSILTANEVPFQSIYKFGKEYLANYPKLIQQRNKVLDEELALSSIPPLKNGRPNPEYVKQEKRLAFARKALENNKIYPALQNGFIQSLSTTVLTIERESSSDYQKMFNELVGLLEDVPGARKWIMKIVKFGPGIEDLLRLVKKGTKDGSTANEYLKNVANKLEGIKKDEDLSAYLSEILANPGQSEMMKVGGSAVMMIDALAKWILFKHYLGVFKESKYNHLSMEQKYELAADMAASPMVRYANNLPETLQTASDTGAWIFPQFILQIQRVIAGLVYTKFASSAVNVGFAASVGQFNHSIFASAFPNKMPASVIFGQYDGNALDLNMVAPERLASEIASIPSLFD